MTTLKWVSWSKVLAVVFAILAMLAWYVFVVSSMRITPLVLP